MKFLTEHLESVDESYGEHFLHAVSFSVRMIGAGLCCMVHAFLPFLFKKTGSACIGTLHDEMVVHRHGLKAWKQERDGLLTK